MTRCAAEVEMTRWTARGGDDKLYGGEGNDELRGGDGDNWLSGGPGDDTLYGDGAGDELYGGPGDDTLYGGAGDDQQLYGGPGDDELYSGGGDALLSGGPGDDELTGGGGADIFRFAPGHSSGGDGDVITDFDFGDGDRLMFIGISLDELTLSNRRDADADGASDDRVITLPDGGKINLLNVGDFTVAELAKAIDERDGGADDGADPPATGGGDDGATPPASGGTGAAPALGVRQNGGAGDDELTGGPGNDDLRGYGGDDELDGGAGNDRLAGMAGTDELAGGDGNDTMYGGPGDDELYGGPGDDRLYAGAGDDYLEGWAGTDRLYGGPGDDAIWGGPGFDWMTGGGGADTFRFAPGHSLGPVGDDGDVITDFDYAAGDRIMLSGFSSGDPTLFNRLDADADGNRDDGAIYLPDGGRIFLLNVGDSLAELAIENIIIGKSASVRVVDDEPASPDPDPDPAPDPQPEQTPTRQGAIVIEIPFSIEHPDINPLTTDYYANHASMYFYGPKTENPAGWSTVSYFSLYAHLNEREDGTPISVKNYWFRDYYNGGTQRLDSPEYRYSDDLKRGLETALESLPNIATAEVITLAADHWRIAITEGPGGLSNFTYDIVLSRPPYEHEGQKWGGGAYARATTTVFIELPQQSGAAQFSFDAVTSGALTPSATAAMDMGIAEGDGATDPLLADPPAAWQMGIDGGFDGNLHLDYIGA